MKAFALLILLLFPSLALAQQQYYGTRAESIVLPPPGDPRDALLLTIHTDDTITPENIRSSIQALYETGRYRTITVDATAAPNGTIVTFLVTSQYFFSTFRLEPADLLDRPITSYFPPPLGKKFSTAPVERLVTFTENLLQETGYFNVTIEPDYIYDDKYSLVTVVLNVKAIPQRAKIGAIQFHDGQQILSDDDLSHALKVSRNDNYDADKVSKGVDQIRQKYVSKGYLTAKVSVETQYDPPANQVSLTFEIEPGKTTIVQVWEVSEAGNQKAEISDTQLRMLVPIFEEGTVDSDLTEEGRMHIIDYYHGQGYFDATAMANLSPVEDQSVRLDYFVTKGDRHRVRSIRIAGSAYFTEAEILKKMKTKQGGLTNRGLFRPDLLQADLRMISAMYRTAGFQSTEIQSTEPQTDHNFDITIQIHEGLRSVLNEITFTGNASFPEPVLWKAAGIQSDQVYSARLIDNAREALSSFYYANGYSDVHVDTHLDFDNTNDTVNVHFDLTEGPQYRIAWIVVAGNTHTAEKVITRTSKLKSNDLYNPEAVLEAQQRLYTLGIFNRVEIVTLDQDLGPLKVLLIQVEDTKPILFTPGIGVTDRSGPRATVEVSDINLFGLARTLSFRVRGGRRERQLEGSYRDPRLFNHEIVGIAAISFDKTTHLDTRTPTIAGEDNVLFRSNEVNFSIQAARKLSNTQTFSLSASYETVNLQDIKSNANIRRFPDTAGLIQIARLGSSLIDDRRDSVIDPTRGVFVTNSLEVANKAYGSEVNFVSIFSQGSYFKSVPGGVVATSVRLGLKRPYGGDFDLPISERFFAGGSTTLRGFRLDEAGPAGGGQLLTIANLEYRAPFNFLPFKDLGGAVFYDTGNVFERPSDFGLAQFTHSAGGGLRYKSPLGIVRIDIGFNLRPKGSERRYSAFFTLGHAF